MKVGGVVVGVVVVVVEVVAVVVVVVVKTLPGHHQHACNVDMSVM